MAEELTTIEAERQYPNISRGHLTHLAQQGVIKARRIGPMWLLEKDSLEHWLANRPKRGGYRGRKAHQKPEAQADQPAQTAEALPARPDRPAVASEKKQPPAPQETVIDVEDAHIKIDPLQPDRQRWMHAEATQGDVMAWCDIRPYPDARWPGGYTIDYYYDRKDRNKKGAMGRNQEERAQALLHLMRDHLTEALQTQGWQILTTMPSGVILWRYQPGQQKEA